MGLHKKLTQWQAAGLISADQMSAIISYDKEHKGSRFMKGLVAAALFAILCGVLSIIAANWMEIGAGTKIGAHVMINTLIAFLLWRAASPLHREGLCLILFGLTLTLIVLIGQVFQLGGTWSGALTLWLIITAPLMVFYSETKITAYPWMLGFLIAVFSVFNEYVEPLPSFWFILFTQGLIIFLPLALIADGNIHFVRQHRPVWADMFIRTGFASLLFGAASASLLWYYDRRMVYDGLSIGESWSADQMQLAMIGLFALALLIQALYAAYRKFYRDDPDDRAAATLAMLLIVSMIIPVLVTTDGGSPVAALHFIVLWLGVGWIAQQQGWHRLVTLSIVMITIRIFAVYCEVFGSLMMTGFGLIVGGTVMLALIWAARKLNRHLKAVSLL